MYEAYLQFLTHVQMLLETYLKEKQNIIRDRRIKKIINWLESAITHRFSLAQRAININTKFTTTTSVNTLSIALIPPFTYKSLLIMDFANHCLSWICRVWLSDRLARNYFPTPYILTSYMIGVTMSYWIRAVGTRVQHSHKNLEFSKFLCLTPKITNQQKEQRHMYILLT